MLSHTWGELSFETADSTEVHKAQGQWAEALPNPSGPLCYNPYRIAAVRMAQASSTITLRPMNSPLTPLDFLARSASVYRDAVAVQDGDRSFTYAEFGERVGRLAAALTGLGVGAGDRVAVLAANGVAPLEAHFGPMRIGAIVVMLNTRLQSGEICWILKHCGAKVLLVDPQLRGLVNDSGVRHIIDDYEGLLAGSRPIANSRESVDENACIAINYTSGTTGFPKGVMFSHRGAWVNAIGELVEYGLNHRSVYLWTQIRR